LVVSLRRSGQPRGVCVGGWRNGRGCRLGVHSGLGRAEEIRHA
jgi:hypothetical protein